MKKMISNFLLLLVASCWHYCQAQTRINDEAIRYQEERMVFKQWDKNKFKPSSGFLGLNPYYWLTWGLMPGYKKTDLRPLGPAGPQTQRIGLVAAMSGTDDKYRLHADTLGYSAVSDIAARSGLLTAADPLWVLYYAAELKPVLDHPDAAILAGLPDQVRQQVLSEGMLDWYRKELDMLKERLEGARTTDMDRGSRIMAYHRILQEYRILAAAWGIRTATAAINMQMARQQEKLKNGQVVPVGWTARSDVEIAKQVLRDRKY